MSDTLADVPSFLAGGVVWTCYHTEATPCGLEWRSPGYRGKVWRHRAVWYASFDGKAIGTFITPKQAMLAASLAARQRRNAA